MLKKIFLLSLFLMTITTLTACKTPQTYDITTTLYPQYDIARNIAGNKQSVGLLTPFGSEVHGYQPTAKDIVGIKSSKLFLYTSDEMDPWVKGILNSSIQAINLSKHYSVVPYDDGLQTDDLHYWTDPENILQLVTVIKDALIKIDSINEAYYEANAKTYSDNIKLISKKIKALTTGLDAEIFFYGHNAMKAFEKRFNIKVSSLSESYKPDAELTPIQLKTLKDKIIAAGSHFLFTEELIDLKAPNALANELKNSGHPVEILELHGFHNISKNQNEEGISYATLLNQNYQNIKKALNR